MAQMHPGELPSEAPFSEQMIFEALAAKTPTEWHVCHGVHLFKQKKDRAIDLEADFVVLVPGRGMVILEAKGGIPRLNDEGRLVVDARDPITQANDFRYDLTADLCARVPGVLGKDVRRLRDETAYAAWLTHTQRLPPGAMRPGDTASHYFLESDLTDPTRAIESLLKAFRIGVNEYRWNTSSIEAIVHALIGDAEIVVPLYRLAEDATTVIERATANQIRVLDRIRPRRLAAVDGVAGSGKTMLAMQLALDFAATEKSVLFLVKSPLVRTCLEHRFATALCEWPQLRLWDWATFREDEVGRPKSERETYDLIVADEAQDMEERQFEYLRERVGTVEGGRFWAFGNRHQALQSSDWRFPAWMDPIELRECIRCPPKVARYAHQLLDIECETPAHGLPVDEPPLVEQVALRSEQEPRVRDLIENLTSGEHKSKSIAKIVLLSPTRLEDSSLASGKVGSNRIVSVDELAPWDSAFPSDGVIAHASFESFKGLESSAVILFDVPLSFDSSSLNIRNFYVSLTRATLVCALVLYARDDLR